MDLTNHETELDEATADLDRHRDPEDTLRQLLDSHEFPQAQIRQLQVSFFASGEVAVRYQPLTEEEWVVIGLS